MKEIYEAPEMDVVLLKSADIICNSGDEPIRDGNEIDIVP